MTSNFGAFKSAVATRFSEMGKHQLFRSSVEKDDLWGCYLSSFPPGTNPIFRQRAEYDCSCCRQFVRSVGDALAVVDGELISVWDVSTGDETYDAVSRSMAQLVKSRPISDVFLSTEKSAGTDRSFEALPDGGPRQWDHFFVRIPSGQRGEKNFVCSGPEVGTKLNEMRTAHAVLLRSLRELTDESVETVLDLISQNSLYRGEEHEATLTAFQGLQLEFKKRHNQGLENFAWDKLVALPGAVTRIRNTAIGTLLVDVSEGLELEQAVKKFEAMVAPTNYKRSTAVVSKAMIERARARVEELGLTSALDRRYATLTDVSVDDVLFADRSAKSLMRDFDPFDVPIGRDLKKTQKTLDKIEEVPVEKFVSDVLPRAASIELLVENRHAGNFVSLTAPADPTASLLFKWDNGFAWSYSGDGADSVKERVKRAGGNVEGDLCCRLAWRNYDDLDLHMIERVAGRSFEISYSNKGPSPRGGRLDVDMNAGRGTTREPVENIFYQSASTMRDGEYELFVHQFAARERSEVGFEAEVAFRGRVWRFAYDKALKQEQRVLVVRMRYSKADGVELLESLPSTAVSKKVWGVDTEQFHRVSLVCLSPNYWGDRGVGNKHYVFALADCRNDGTARGFYNEFLRQDLDRHRKVLEMVGARMRTDESTDQLSGLGFSSTLRSSVVARVRGAFTRQIRITF